MQNYPSSNPSPSSARKPGLVTSLWERLQRKNVAFLTLPLLIMATITEFVILATGFKYQQAVCLPQGMGVTLFGIGPIGATILAVELLKLPLAIWTASRQGGQKLFMLFVGLPLICVLTFQLVKDMAVYEMGIAMEPAAQALEKAAAEEVKIAQLQGNLGYIEAKRADRDRKLTELAARKAKAKADHDELVKRNEEARQDAISLTDYQKKELADLEIRQGTLIRQFDADAAQITKSIADLRAQREAELIRATKWNAEEARLENAYKAKLAEYTNKKTAYDKAKAEYDSANVLKRQLMKEPVSPGVPPERETNTSLKSTVIADLEAQIKAKEAELTAVNARRRDGVAQVGTDARKLRAEFDSRSSTKRAETDKKREELTAAQAALAAQWLAEEKQIEQEFAAAAGKADNIHAELDAARKSAEEHYEAREAAIRQTQVHRIATTVEIVRGLIFGERPVSITASAKERGDLLTDQISMVRIWVYPVLAFIVAFLPTLMVEIGFSTVFKPEQARPPHRLGFLGRRLHWLYTRAGRQKILRAERLATEASGAIATRDRALAEAKAATDKALAAKEAELKSVREAATAAATGHVEQLQKKEEAWAAQLANMADALNHMVVEKDALRDLQKAEIDHQVQLRQNAWSERVSQLRQELDAQRAAAEAERTALIQEQHKQSLALSEDCKAQVTQARRQLAEAQLAAQTTQARLTQDLKEARQARELAESQLKLHADGASLQLAQAQDHTAREVEKAVRLERQRLERQQTEAGKELRQRAEDFERQWLQREQELTLAAEARAAGERNKAEQESRRREAELESRFEERAREADARRTTEAQAREAAAETRLKQREMQWQAQTESKLRDAQAQAAEQLRRREAEFERRLEAQAREAAARAQEELQQKELAFHAKLKQREQELIAQAAARETELQGQFAAEARARQQEWEKQAESRVRAAEARSGQESRQQGDLAEAQARQRDQQWQAKLDALRAELQAQHQQALRRRDTEADASLRELEGKLRKEMLAQDEAAQARARQREQEIAAQLAAQAEAHHAAQARWETEAEEKTRVATAHYRALLDRAEKERDEAKEFAADGYRQVQNLEKKLTEASAFLNGLKNKKDLIGKDAF
jgi:hypothetical protein